MSKISGPLLDRIDLHIEVPAVKYKELASRDSSEQSKSIRERVIIARDIQRKRFAGRKGMFSNADMESRDIQSYCRIESAGEELLKMRLPSLAYQRVPMIAFSRLQGRSPTLPGWLRSGRNTSARRYNTGVWIEICGKRKNQFRIIPGLVCFL